MVPSYLEVGAGPVPLVFLHGIGGDKTSFAPQLEAFGQDYRCLSWDMPGYGDNPPVTELTWQGLSEALLALLDAAAVEKAVLVGHSMGGMVAQDFISRYPARVAGLVLYGTSPAFGGKGGDFQQEFLAERLRPIERGKTPADIAPKLVDMMVGLTAEPAGIEAAIASMSRLSAEAYVASMQCLVTFEGRENLPKIAVPTLCLVGEKDRNAPPSVSEKMAEKIPGAKCVVLPKLGHLANLEQPAQFNAALRAYLDENKNIILGEEA